MKENRIFIGPPNLSVLPTWLDVNISIDVKEFWYNKFNSSEFTGDVNYDSKTSETICRCNTNENAGRKQSLEIYSILKIKN